MTTAGFEEARRAKVLSVDPNGIVRSDVDGTDRASVFRLLHSFDDTGLDARPFAEAACRLVGGIGQSPEEVLAGFVGHAQRDGRGDAGEQTVTEATRSAVLAEADAILEHRFVWEGIAYQLPPRIDWDCNYATPGTSSCLNRFGFLMPLYRAYEFTGDPVYARKAIALILAWIEDTDICESFQPGTDPTQWVTSVKRRYVWLSHLEPASHLVAWSRALGRILVRDQALIVANDFLCILKSVHDQLWWLHHIMPEGGHGNGLTHGVASQLCTIAAFPMLRDARPLAQTAMARLVDTLPRQILADGVQHELTPHYHTCVTLQLLDILACESRLPCAVPAAVRRWTRKMLQYLRQTLTPDGGQAALNDSDPYPGAWTPGLLARPPARELLGQEAESELESECFPCAGHAIMRQGSRFGRNELYMLFDVGPFGNCHQHEDKLSFCLSAYGRLLVADPGRYGYDHTPGSYYMHLVSTRAHSTVRIDDGDQRSRAHPEAYVSREPVAAIWKREEDGTVRVSASYDFGYGPDAVPVTHGRSIFFCPEPGYWVVVDRIAGAGAHRVESRFQFAPGALRLQERLVRTLYPDANLALVLLDGHWTSMDVECGLHDPKSGWYAPRSGCILPAPALVLRAGTVTLPFTARTLLYPFRGTQIPTELDALRDQLAGSSCIE